jgi:hypothetical protein
MRNPMIGLGADAKGTPKDTGYISFFYIVKKWHLDLNIFKLKNCMLYSTSFYGDNIWFGNIMTPLQNRMG